MILFSLQFNGTHRNERINKAQKIRQNRYWFKNKRMGIIPDFGLVLSINKIGSFEKVVDLIFMGSHVKEKCERWYVVSAVEQVSVRSICPVVFVRI